MDTNGPLLEQHTVPDNTQKQRLSDYLVGIFANLPSRKSVKKAIDNSRVLVNKKVATTGMWVLPNMSIALVAKPAKPVYKLPLEVAYEDQHLAIVNKPSGLSTSGNEFKTLENALPFNLKIVGHYRPLPVHRLDRATSGLVIVAKSAQARIRLGQLLEGQKISKVYYAIVRGQVNTHSVINQPIDGKPAKTKILEVRPTIKEHLSLLKLSPLTGRTHQLRIHCARSGFPIVGDTIYGDHSIGKGLLLCASQLSFIHPINDTMIDVNIPLPRKFQKLLP